MFRVAGLILALMWQSCAASQECHASVCDESDAVDVAGTSLLQRSLAASLAVQDPPSLEMRLESIESRVATLEAEVAPLVSKTGASASQTTEGTVATSAETGAETTTDGWVAWSSTAGPTEGAETTNEAVDTSAWPTVESSTAGPTANAEATTGAVGTSGWPPVESSTAGPIGTSGWPPAESSTNSPTTGSETTGVPQVWTSSAGFGSKYCFEKDGSTILTDQWGNKMMDYGSGCPIRCPAAVDGNGNAVAMPAQMAWPPAFVCPKPCYEKDGSTILADQWGNKLMDYGSGCPIRCPAAVDGNGNAVAIPQQMAWPPTFACPLVCLGANGTALEQPGMAGQFVTIWPAVSEKRTFDNGSVQYYQKAIDADTARSKMCPITCPGSTNLVWPTWGPDSTGNNVPQGATCPAACPGNPTDCSGNAVMSTGGRCPVVCDSIRNCSQFNAGLSYTDKCPTSCYEKDGSTILTDQWGNKLMDYGSGCPIRCPAAVDGNGNAVAMPAQMAWPPTFSCPLVCLGADGTAMQQPGMTMSPGMPGMTSFITVWPSISQKRTLENGTVLYYQKALDADTARRLMCPAQCSTGLTWPQWGDDGQGNWVPKGANCSSAPASLLSLADEPMTGPPDCTQYSSMCWKKLQCPSGTSPQGDGRVCDGSGLRCDLGKDAGFPGDHSLKRCY